MNQVVADDKSTKERILDAAEQLFAERGYDGTSLRAITAEAGVNLAAVHYHFQSKESLMQAIFARRLHPINERRLALLDGLEAQAGRKPPAVSAVLRALIEPIFRHGSPADGVGFPVLLGRIYTEPSLWPVIGEMLQDIVPRFVQALQRALPGYSREEIFWRLHFTMGSVGHTLAGAPVLKLLSRGSCDSSDTAEVIERLVEFVSAGSAAPPHKGAERRKPERRSRGGRGS